LGRTIAWDNPTAEDVPVLVPGWLLNEAVAEARDTPEREIAGVLAGHLCQDTAARSIFVSVTCLISGRDTVQSTEGTVTLTAETWRLARELIHLRGAGEAIIGWYHSHPFRLCSECPLPAPAECVNKILFFSQDDVQVMETLFDQPYMIGLLVASETRLERSLGHLPLRLFGWRDGEVCARGLEVLYES
jgi:proteasome lid subunit RPN8/RPN11